MADLAGGVVKVTVEETTAEQPVSEALAQKIGSAINLFADRTKNMDIKVFTSSGTWTKPEKLQKAVVICTGRGGDGYSGLGGGGGGAGGTGIRIFNADELAESVSVALSSTETAFGSHIVATRGQSVVTGTGVNIRRGGNGGFAFGGQINIEGGSGGNAMGSDNSAGPSGGASFWGGGGRGGVAAAAGAPAFSAEHGEAYGSGGGAGGGLGAPGICIVIELF